MKRIFASVSQLVTSAFITMMAVLPCVMVTFPCCSLADTGIPPDFHVGRHSFLGCVWNKGHAEASVISQDGGYSYAVPGGSLWWFGDTFKGSRDHEGKPSFHGGAVSCALAFLEDKNRQKPPVLKYLSGNEGTVAQAITFLSEESWDHHRIWPGAGIYMNGKSYIYYALIKVGKGTWDFQHMGSGLAYSEKPVTAHKRIQTHEDWRFPVHPIAIVQADDWLYLFEVWNRRGKQGVWLSRVRPERLEDPRAYEFYSGMGPVFSRQKDQQVLLLENVYGQVSIVWNEYLKRYVLASSSDFSRPREIRFYTASNPLGPWSKATATITVPEYLQNKKVELVYCSYFHPEYFRNNGQVMNLTFSLHLQNSGFDSNNEMLDVEIQKPDE